MPLLVVKLTPRSFTEAAKLRLAEAFTTVACRAESVPDKPIPRSRALILMEELPEAGFFSAGRPAGESIRGVFAWLYVQTGVLDAARRAQFAAEFQAAAETAADPNDARTVVTSAILTDVPEGFWAQTGKIRRLPEVAAIAEFEHLAAIAERRA